MPLQAVKPQSDSRGLPLRKSRAGDERNSQALAAGQVPGPCLGTLNKGGGEDAQGGVHPGHTRRPGPQSVIATEPTSPENIAGSEWHRDPALLLSVLAAPCALSLHGDPPKGVFPRDKGPASTAATAHCAGSKGAGPGLCLGIACLTTMPGPSPPTPLHQVAPGRAGLPLLYLGLAGLFPGEWVPGKTRGRAWGLWELWLAAPLPYLGVLSLLTDT